MAYDKVAYLVPSEKVRMSAEAALKDEILEGWVNVIKVDQENVEGEYRDLVRAGYGCIVARGGTYHEFQQLQTTVPVIEERIRTADVLQQVTDHFDSSGGKMYVVLYRSVAIGCENLERLMGGRVKFQRYEDKEQLKEILDSIRSEDVTVLSSGIAEDLLRDHAYRLIEIKTRPETMRTTAAGARKLMRQMQENISRTNILNSIYNNVDEGILIFRPDNKISELNLRAEYLLGKNGSELLERDIYDVIPGMPAKRSDGSCSIDSPTVITVNINKKLLNLSIYPFQLVKGTVRNMVIIQDVTKIQETERKIRMHLANKGLVAVHTFDDILTQDPEMGRTIRMARKVAKYDGSVLIYGESGTGKELFAQSIHNASERRNGPFVAINCGALTDSLLESELFGYAEGAFTGARKEGKAGLFELAHNGTIFLDEVNSTSKNMQTKILRVLEERQVMRVGSDYVIPLDIRVISASNGDLPEAVANGEFRQDLFFRLNTFEIKIPPVRDRKKDIPLLFDYYLHKEFPDAGPVPAEVMEKLTSYPWNGNVREIKSAAYRYYAFRGDKEDVMNEVVNSEADRRAVRVENADGVPDWHEDTVPLDQLSSAVEKIVIETLEGRGMTQTEIANALNISRQALYKKRKK